MAHSSPSLAARCAQSGPAELPAGFGMRSALGMQRGLCSFQWALWQSLLQYLTRPQREQLDRVGSWRSQWAQMSASSLEAGFFFLGGMALGEGFDLCSTCRKVQLRISQWFKMIEEPGWW